MPFSAGLIVCPTLRGIRLRTGQVLGFGLFRTQERGQRLPTPTTPCSRAKTLRELTDSRRTLDTNELTYLATRHAETQTNFLIVHRHGTHRNQEQKW